MPQTISHKPKIQAMVGRFFYHTVSESAIFNGPLRLRITKKTDWKSWQKTHLLSSTIFIKTVFIRVDTDIQNLMKGETRTAIVCEKMVGTCKIKFCKKKSA